MIIQPSDQKGKTDCTEFPFMLYWESFWAAA
jgi:hypothetical protein